MGRYETFQRQMRFCGGNPIQYINVLEAHPPLVMVIAQLSGLETELSPKIETAGSHGYLCPFMAISTRRLAIR